MKPLIEVLKKCPAEDTHLRQAARIALRNCLRDDEKAWPEETNKGIDPIYVEMAVAIPTRRAAQFLLTQLTANQVPQNRLPAALEHIGRYGEEKEIDNGIVLLTNRRYDHSIGDGLMGFLRGLQSRNIKLSVTQRPAVIGYISSSLFALLPEKFGVTREEYSRQLLSLLKVVAALPALVGSWNENEFDPQKTKLLEYLLKESKYPTEFRIAATEAILRALPERGIPTVRTVFADPKTPADMRERMAIPLASSAFRELRLDARDLLKDAPYRLAIAIGTALATSPDGALDLLDAVRMGKAPARLLQERVILERLRAAKVPNLDRQIADLTKGLPALDQRLADLMKQRASNYASAKTDKELGAKLYVKHCGACHRLADQGGKIAPQLDGIGVRGLERLLEDVLDPNRNVDQAFRARVITTKDDRTITGLMLRVEGEVLIVADAEGKEIRIPTKDIDKNRETMLSPMPANFGDVIPEPDFYHLMAYLLDQKAKEPAKK